MSMAQIYESSIRVVPVHVCSHGFKNYSYVVSTQNSKAATIIDPAWELEKYLEVLEINNLIPTHVLLTHTHFDHMNLVKQFVDRFQVDVWVSEKERMRLLTSSHCVKSFSHLEKLQLNHLECTVYETPGHSPGSSCFLIGANLFSGDTLFIEGCGICDDPESSPEQLYESIKFLKQTLSENVKIYPGHRFQSYPGQTMDFVLKNNLYLHFEEKNDFVKYRMRKNKINLLDFK